MTQEIYKQRIEEAAKIYAESEVNRMDNSKYSMNEKKRLKMFDGYDIEEALISFSKQILQNQWISVEEALPECDKCHLAMYEDGGIIVAKYENETWWWQDGFVVGRNTDGDLMYSSSCKVPSGLITHWMPIPSLKGGEE